MITQEKYEACMLLHALGDTIGFKNGEWEMQNIIDGDLNDNILITWDIQSQFISLGGVTFIDLKKWSVSDDTLFHIAVAENILKYGEEFNDNVISELKQKFTKVYEQIIIDEKNGLDRIIGITTKESIRKFTKIYDERINHYDLGAGGNGCAMRNLCIGLIFYGKENRTKLMEYSIQTSRITHNNVIGALGGFNTALFVAFAIEGIPIKLWINKFIKILRSEELKKYLELDNDDAKKDYDEYLRFMYNYNDMKFKEANAKSFANMSYRLKFHYDNFRDNTNRIGFSAHGAILFAYDALYDCNGIWEKLIWYSMLNSGDSDTIGAIAGGLFGIVYGYNTVPKNLLKHIEYKDKLINIGKKLYKLSQK